jgi:hypothetical protein
MQRRQLLKSIAASSAIGIGAGSAAGRQVGGATDIEQYDTLHVVRGDKTVETLENPTWDDIRSVEARLDDDQQLVTSTGECTAYCESNCPCYPCAYSCSSCCDPDNNICNDCDDGGSGGGGGGDTE